MPEESVEARLLRASIVLQRLKALRQEVGARIETMKTIWEEGEGSRTLEAHQWFAEQLDQLEPREDGDAKRS